MPAGFTKLTGPSVNWGFETVPQPELNNRRMHYPQGRTLGGSTSINAMIYIRGNREDYDEWRDLGNEGWGYDGVLPYFRKSENNERLADEYHGTGGADERHRAGPAQPDLEGVRARRPELGIPFSHDFNGAEPGRRRLLRRHPAKRPPGERGHRLPAPGAQAQEPDDPTHAQATQLIIENGRARGVEYTVQGQAHEALDADGEVVAQRRRGQLATAAAAVRYRPRRRTRAARHQHGS